MLNKALMAIFAHADDIELNVGGTLLKYRDRGYGVIYVMSTNNMSGQWSRVKEDGSVEVTAPAYSDMEPRRKEEAAAAAKVFGTTPIHLNHPQRHYTRADGSKGEVRYGCDRPHSVPPNVPTILTAHEDESSVRRVTDLILEHKPEAVLTHSMIQVDMEHVGTALLATKAYWKAVDAGYEGMLLHTPCGYITMFGEANCRWDTFVDTTGYWDGKLAAIALHVCQMPKPYRHDFPPLRRSLAWGTACGCQHAEVFTIAGRPKLPPQYADFTLEIVNHI